MRYYWEQQNDDDPSAISGDDVDPAAAPPDDDLDRQLPPDTSSRISLTDYQILKALQLSETGTWLLSRMAWHLMVHATTVTLAVERLETKQLVKRLSHPHDRRATLVAITE